MIGLITGKIKMYLAAAVGLVMAGLFAWIKIVKAQKDAADARAENAESKAESLVEKTKVQSKITNAVAEAREKANEVERDNEDRRADGSRPSGDFGDPRL